MLNQIKVQANKNRRRTNSRDILSRRQQESKQLASELDNEIYGDSEPKVEIKPRERGFNNDLLLILRGIPKVGKTTISKNFMTELRKKKTVYVKGIELKTITVGLDVRG